MRVAFFDTHAFERRAFDQANHQLGHEIVYLDHRLTEQTAATANGFRAVCAFVNDRLDQRVLQMLKKQGTEFILLRSAGFNHVDLQAAASEGLRVARVPSYSPEAVAEHAVMLILALNRKICRASARIHELNFSLEGLVGFDLHGKTVGVIGAGRIGCAMLRIMNGFGCRLLAYDPKPNLEFSKKIPVEWVSLDQLLSTSDVISLHMPLTPQTRHLIDDKALALTKRGVMLINTSRGALIDTAALIRSLKLGQIGAAGLDVYEEEEGIFFNDLSNQVLMDDVLARLLTFPNVLITSHQAFLTIEALDEIAQTTLQNLSLFEQGAPAPNEIRAP